MFNHKDVINVVPLSSILSHCQ